MRIILASSSPRRQMLLKSAGFDLKIIEPHVDERVRPSELPEIYVRRLAEEKASFVSRENEFPVVAADTVVVLDAEIIGKPKDENEARKMLQRLSGREHKVFTGFAVRRAETIEVGMVVTTVGFRPLSSLEIESYLITKEPLDKAGAYGIQGFGASLIDQIDGSFTNVIGLPLKEVMEVLHRLAPKLGT